MGGEPTSYTPAVVWARQQIAEGAFGRVFYSEGDYLHDLDNGFYAAYQYSGGEDWKPTASYPPMLYPTHAIGGGARRGPPHPASPGRAGARAARRDAAFARGGSPLGRDLSHHGQSSA